MSKPNYIPNIAGILLLLALIFNAGRSMLYKYLTGLLSDDDVQIELINDTPAIVGFVSLPPDSAGDARIHGYYGKGVQRRAQMALHSGDTSSLLLSFSHGEHQFVLRHDSVFDVTSIFDNGSVHTVFVSQACNGTRGLPGNAYQRSYLVLVGDVAIDILWHGILVVLMCLVGSLPARRSAPAEDRKSWSNVRGGVALLLLLSAGLLLVDAPFVYHDIQAIILIGGYM